MLNFQRVDLPLPWPMSGMLRLHNGHFDAWARLFRSVQEAWSSVNDAVAKREDFGGKSGEHGQENIGKTY